MHTQQKKFKRPTGLSGLFLVPGWKPKGAYKISIVRVSGVRLLRIISETTPRIFPKPDMKLGVKNVRNVARPLFFRFWPVLVKAADLCEKKHFWPFLAIFGSFWAFEENPFRGFCLNFARMCQKIVKKIGQSFRLGKFDISEILGEVISKNWRQRPNFIWA